MPHYIEGMAGEQLSDYHEAHPIQSMEEAATKCTPGVGHRQSPGGTYTYNTYTFKGCSGMNPNI